MYDIEKPLTYIRDKAKEYAQALSDREHLKEYRKSKKAMLINEAEQKGIKGQQARESYAYSHQEYIELLDGLRVAIEREAAIRMQIKAAELRIEVWRSQNARAKAEMNMR